MNRLPDGSIQTVVGRGYRLNAAVFEGTGEDENDRGEHGASHAGGQAVAEPEQARPPESIQSGDLGTPRLPHTLLQNPLEQTIDATHPGDRFGDHLRHVLSGSVLYALLYAVALLLEVAYQFDRYGEAAVRLAPAVFLWILATTLVSLAASARLSPGGRVTGLVVPLLVLLGSGLLLCVVMGQFLPATPITEIRKQAQTAQGAFFKNACYFMPLAVVFLFLPFHFITSLQRELRSGRRRRVHDLLFGRRRSVSPENTIYLKVWQLGALLSGAAVLSLALTFSLLDSLEPGVYTNLFTLLVFLRVLLYFTLGLECLLWYAHSLNMLKRESLTEL